MDRLTCFTCRQELPATDFHVCRQRKTGRHGQCKKCKAEYIKQFKTPAFRAKRQEAYRKKKQEDPLYCRRASLMSRYGLTLADYGRLVEQQKGTCAICGQSGDDKDRVFLVVDHDHSTGEIRGLLCDLCNTGLGRFRDSLPLVASALIYLRAYTNA